MSRDHDNSGWLAGLVVGAIGGCLLGLLFAPKKGTELQEDIKVFLDSIPERVEDEMAPDSNTRQMLDRARYNIEDKVERFSANRDAKRHMAAKAREDESYSSEYRP